MNSYLSLLSGKTKTASAEPELQEIDLSKISGADLLAGLEDGSIVLPEQEKVAEEEGEFDLSKLSEEQLLQLAEELGGQEKVASDEADSWDAAGRIFARGFLDEIDSGAEITGDMNVRDVLEKQAGARWEAAKAMGRRAGHSVANAFKATEMRAGLASRKRHLAEAGDKPNRFFEQSLKEDRGAILRGAGKAAAAYGSAGAAGVGAYKGIQAMREKKKQGR